MARKAKKKKTSGAKDTETIENVRNISRDAPQLFFFFWPPFSKDELVEEENKHFGTQESDPSRKVEQYATIKQVS